MFRSRAAPSRAEAGEPMKTGKDGRERTRKHVKTNHHLGRRKGSGLQRKREAKEGPGKSAEG